MQIQNRIKELRQVKASELLPNPKNWRTHPVEQSNALRGVLSEIGYADALIAYETDNGLMLIDGHLRAETTPDMEVPVLVTDLSSEEADKLLATLDPLAAMANSDSQALNSLLASIETNNESLIGMLSTMEDFGHITINDGIKWQPEIDTTTGEHAVDVVGYDLGSVWMRDGDVRTRVYSFLLPLPPNPAKNKKGELSVNYSRSPAREMERIVKTYMRENDKFLEVCAGWFTFSTTAALWGYSGVGIDIWKTSLSFGHKQRAVLPEGSGSFDIVDGDACSLPYEENSFDFVYCNPPFYQLEKYSTDSRDISADQTLEGWLNRSGKMLSEMERVVSPDGLIVTVMADARINGSFVSLHSLWIAEAESRGLVLHDIAIQHLLSQQLGFWKHAFKAKRTAKAHEYIIVFKKSGVRNKRKLVKQKS